jgi:hypothetical protein
MISEDIGDVKLPLPKFLKLFTNNNVSVPKAMAVAGKMFVVIPVLGPSNVLISISYKEYNTPSKLGELSEVRLKAAGVEDKDDRNLIMQALRKVGYAYKGEPLKKLKDSQQSSVSASGSSTAVQALVR